MFDLSPLKILLLAVIAVVVFGPDQLPRIAAQAGRAVRELRRLAEGAQADLREGLGPEFSDFNIADLSPRRLVSQHLLGPLESAATLDAAVPSAHAPAAVSELSPGENPPYDTEAT